MSNSTTRDGDVPAAQDKPEKPTEIHKQSWKYVGRKVLREFSEDQCTDQAAALTYYAVLAVFPALLALFSVLGLVGQGQKAVKAITDIMKPLVSQDTLNTFTPILESLARSQGAGIALIIGVAGALWSASGYIGAFIRASNAIYKMEEGRPMWKTLPLRVGLTLGMVILLAITAIGVVITGVVAERIGALFGIGSTGVLIWDIAKWPVLAVLVSLAIALLYWAAPNVQHPGFRWLTPGSVLAVVLWVIASVGFGVYVANFGSYNKTYGSLAAVVVFLVWLWISNLAVLLGAEFDAELARSQRIETGQPEDKEPFLPPRDTRAMDEPRTNEPQTNA
jgi:membrane protein